MKPEANLHRTVSTQLLDLDEPAPNSRGVSPSTRCASRLCEGSDLSKSLIGVIPRAIPEPKGPLCLLGRLNFAEMQSRVSQLPLSTRLELCEIRHRAQQANNITEQAAYPD